MGLFSSPLSRIIGLSLVLAVGFLFTVLAGALYGNWLPMISALFFLVAHIPTIICNQWSSDDFMSESSQNIVDLGKFLSGLFASSALLFPLILFHVRIINLISLLLTLSGGVLIYGTVVGFTSYFEKDEELTGFEI